MIQTIKEEKQKEEKALEEILEWEADLEKQWQEVEITYGTEKQKMDIMEETIQKIEKRIEKLKDEQNELEKQKKQAQKSQEEIKQRIETLSEETENFKKIIEEYAENNQENQKYIDDLNADITNLKISVSSFDESEMSIEEIQERIKQELETNQISKETKEKQQEEMKQENNNLKQIIEETESKIEAIKQEVQNSSSKIENLKKERTQKNERLIKQEEEITQKFGTIEELKAELVKREVKKAKVQEDIDGIINKMWEEYELTPSAVKEYEKPQNVASTQKRVNTLRKEMKEIGSVNIDAIEEYKTLKQRYDSMSEQRLDLETTMAKLRKIITDMTQIMKEQFKEKFQKINRNFNEVFIELFGGGKAELKLEDEENILECGIEIAVEPPGKKLQNMMLLSGGEKALTAIALLFAILKINPAPFCVLDEIEAALDDVNVYRYAEYLKKFAQDTQFLVITHRKGTMEVADTIYGVTMEENGISKLLSMKLK